MENGKTLFTTAARQLLRRDRGKTVTPQELLAYHRGELSEEERADLKDRLARQPEAARAAVDLARFPDVEPEDESLQLTAAAVAADWAELEARLLESESRTPGSAAPLAEHRTASVARWPLALAAVFLLATLALSYWVMQLRRTVEELSGPRKNVRVATLSQGAYRTADQPAPETISLTAKEESILLILSLRRTEATAEYRADIRDEQGGTVLQVGGLVPDPGGNLTVELPGARISTGRYEITLWSSLAHAPAAAYAVDIEKKE